jgi:hypothetical protein
LITGVVVIGSPVEVCFHANDNAPQELVVVTDLRTAQKKGIAASCKDVTGGIGNAAMAPSCSNVPAYIETTPNRNTDWISCGVGHRRRPSRRIEIGSE